MMEPVLSSKTMFPECSAGIPGGQSPTVHNSVRAVSETSRHFPANRSSIWDWRASLRLWEEGCCGDSGPSCSPGQASPTIIPCMKQGGRCPKLSTNKCSILCSALIRA